MVNFVQLGPDHPGRPDERHGHCFHKRPERQHHLDRRRQRRFQLRRPAFFRRRRNWNSVVTGWASTSYTDNTVAGNTSYIYQVDATDTTGTSAWSTSSNIALSLPATPTSVTATASTSAQSVSITWTEGGNGASSYNIHRSADGGTTWPTTFNGILTIGYTDTAVSPNTSYLYQIDAANGTGTTVWSASSNAALTIPAAPTGLTYDPPTVSSITLHWTDPSPTTNITGYHIYRSTDNATWGSVYATASGANTTSTTVSATAGTAYYYKVNAYDTTGDSATGATQTYPMDAVIGLRRLQLFNRHRLQPLARRRHRHNYGFAASPGWKISDTSKAAIVTGSLAYPKQRALLATSGNYVTLSTGTTTATQTLANSVGNNGTTLWFSYELNELSLCHQGGQHVYRRSRQPGEAWRSRTCDWEFGAMRRARATLPILALSPAPIPLTSSSDRSSTAPRATRLRSG